jgi:hypothetical protein
MTATRHFQAWLLAAGLAVAAGVAAAAPGDVLQVKVIRADLRDGPSEATDVQTQVEQGDELVELRREGDWLGVRVLRTGDEGWIFRGHVDRLQLSPLDADALQASP